MLTYNLQLLGLSTCFGKHDWIRKFHFLWWVWIDIYVMFPGIASSERCSLFTMLVVCVCVCSDILWLDTCFPVEVFVHQSDWVSNICSAFQLSRMQWLYSHFMWSVRSGESGWRVYFPFAHNMCSFPFLDMILLRTRFGRFGKDSQIVEWQYDSVMPTTFY